MLHDVPLPLPAPGSAHLWQCDIDAIDDPSLLHGYQALLDAAELVRMRRLVFERDRHRFLVSHALLRSVLSRYVDVAAESWRFVTGPHGKPALAAKTVLPGVDFNLSHSGSHALLALSAGCESTGVDIERHRSTRDFHGLAQRKFAPREAARLRLYKETELMAEFHDIWTLKEAFVKATGEGLSRSLADFHFDFDRENETLNFAARADLEPDPQKWHFWCYRLEGVYSAALALRVCAGADTGQPRWFDMVPQRRWGVLDVPCLLRTRRITSNQASGGRTR